jgi:hypothetical protein
MQKSPSGVVPPEGFFPCGEMSQEGQTGAPEPENGIDPVDAPSEAAFLPCLHPPKLLKGTLGHNVQPPVPNMTLRAAFILICLAVLNSPPPRAPPDLTKSPCRLSAVTTPQPRSSAW